MKAVYCTRYGQPEVLQVVEKNIPTPQQDEVLVRNYAASITRADTFMRQGTPKIARLFVGLQKPKHPITGTGFAGQVVRTHPSVTAFQTGDRVYGETLLHFGANAEYVAVNTKTEVIRPLPTELNYSEAAAVCDGALTSFNFLIHLGQLKPEQKILIIGASGALGMAAIQIAKINGAEVTAVCSGANAELVKKQGADYVIDYKKEDFTQKTTSYDLIYDAVGVSSFSKTKKVLTPKGQYLTPVINLSILCCSLGTRLFGKQKAIFAATGLTPVDQLQAFLDQIEPWLVARKLSIFIDQEYPIEQIVEAHQYLETGRKRGNIVIKFPDSRLQEVI